MRSVWLVALLTLTACAPNATKIVASSTTLPVVTSTTEAATTTTIVAATTTTVALVDRILAAPIDEVEHAFPIATGVNASYAHTHGEYPAADVFADCGTEVHAMATGVVQHVRRVDGYNKKTDNPALRGGKSVSVVGLDAVRYYTSHLDRIDVEVGQAVNAGDVLGTIGLTGDSQACHTHVGISPLCPSVEWSVRRGVIWPWPYLDAWRKGQQKSPVAEIRAWSTGHADACAKAAADPHAAD
jgi:peptidoglycan LD-endopeptidase LytH